MSNIDFKKNWKNHPYFKMNEEEQIEYEVYSDGVDMKELYFIKTKRSLDILKKEENKLTRY